MIKFIKTDEKALIPKLAHEDDSGFDLSSIHEHVIRPGGRELISTGISCEMPPGYTGRISPRSGLAVKFGIDVLGGVIDAPYRGELMVCLINHGAYPFLVSPGDRIAQIVFTPILTDAVEWKGTVSETERGASGFGSTGK